jgi:hypothetical protein
MIKNEVELQEAVKKVAFLEESIWKNNLTIQSLEKMKAQIEAEIKAYTP